MTVVGNTLYFTANDGNSGTELWRSDGTEAGTVRVADIYSGGYSSEPRHLRKVGNTLFFTATNGVAGRELWALDLVPLPPPVISIGALSASKIEGTNPSTSTQFTFTVTRTGNITSSSSAAWRVSGGGTNPAIAADFTGNVLPSGTVAFAANETSKTITVNIVADTFVEPTNSFTVTLSNPVGTIIGTVSANGSIQNDDLSADSIPPTLSSITTEGNQLSLLFSEPVVSSGLTANQFAAYVGSETVPRTISSISAGSTSSEIKISLTGSQPLSSQSIYLGYADLSTTINDEYGVIQDLAGNDLASIPSPGKSASVFNTGTSVNSLASTYSSILLTGSSTINAKGNAGRNIITGNIANNVLDGLAGIDSIDGTDGSDVYLISRSEDHPVAEVRDSGSSGIDEIRFASTRSNQTLIIYAGDTGIERVTIGTGANAVPDYSQATVLSINASASPSRLDIYGNNGNNNLRGTAFDDLITGHRGNDLVNGGLGSDTLILGAGSDTVRFDSQLNGQANIDSVVDFTPNRTPSRSDIIQLENSIFTALRDTGTLASSAFCVGTSFTNTVQRIRYDDLSGNLFYDPDGTSRASSVLLANLVSEPDLTNAQFEVT